VADDVVLGDVAATGPGSGRAGERAALAFALLTGACIATYTIVDSAGSRAGESGVAYGLASVAASGVAICVANALRPSRRARAGMLRRDWRRHLAGGVGTLVAYTMVLVAVRRAPVGYVTMLRESSVVIGALVGWLVLGEGLGRRRLVASGVILAGLVLLVVAGR
jgi:drug/metabolite transporter (DMT)-like permease